MLDGDGSTVVLMPLRDKMSAPTRLALDNLTSGPIRLMTEIGLPVDEARNRLTSRVMQLEPRPTFVMWIDGDAYWDSVMFDRLRSHITKLGPTALVAPIYGPRMPYSETHATKLLHPPHGTPLQWGIDYPKTPDDPNALVRVIFQGAHMYAHDIRLLDRLGSAPWSLSDSDPSEDFAFVRRLHESGGALWCDTACPAFHVDEASGYAYLPGMFGPFVIGGDGQPVPINDSAVVSTKEERRSYGPAVDARMKRNAARNGVCLSAGNIEPAKIKAPGRNDTCPCQSGNKFKKCCGA